MYRQSGCGEVMSARKQVFSKSRTALWKLLQAAFPERMMLCCVHLLCGDARAARGPRRARCCSAAGGDFPPANYGAGSTFKVLQDIWFSQNEFSKLNYISPPATYALAKMRTGPMIDETSRCNNNRGGLGREGSRTLNLAGVCGVCN